MKQKTKDILSNIDYKEFTGKFYVTQTKGNVQVNLNKIKIAVYARNKQGVIVLYRFKPDHPLHGLSQDEIANSIRLYLGNRFGDPHAVKCVVFSGKNKIEFKKEKTVPEEKEETVKENVDEESTDVKEQLI